VFGSENDVRVRNTLEARPKMGAENEGTGTVTANREITQPTHIKEFIYIIF
jgi:hypothetical protein